MKLNMTDNMLREPALSIYLTRSFISVFEFMAYSFTEELSKSGLLQLAQVA